MQGGALLERLMILVVARCDNAIDRTGNTDEVGVVDGSAAGGSGLPDAALGEELRVDATDLLRVAVKDGETVVSTASV